MKADVSRLELEKKIYERLGHIDKDIENLVRANYSLINMLIPSVKPTKQEIEAIRSKGKFVSLERVIKRLKNV